MARKAGQLLPLREVARLAGVHRNTLGAWITAGVIPETLALPARAHGRVAGYAFLPEDLATVLRRVARLKRSR